MAGEKRAASDGGARLWPSQNKLGHLDPEIMFPYASGSVHSSINNVLSCGCLPACCLCRSVLMIYQHDVTARTRLEVTLAKFAETQLGMLMQVRCSSYALSG